MQIAKSQNFGWLVFLTMLLSQLCLYDVVFNSLFVLPLAAALGVTRGTVLVFATFYSVAGIAVSAGYGALLSNRKIPLWTLLSGAVVVEWIAFALFAFGNQVWMIYLAGLLIAVPVQGCTVVTPVVFAANWYAMRVRGRLMAIQNCVRGISGIVLPLLVQLAINAGGYRMGYLVLAVAAIPFFVMGFVVKARTPAEMGLKPLDWKRSDSADSQEPVHKADNPDIGWNLRHAMKTPAFWLMMATIGVFGSVNGFASNFSGIVGEFITDRTGDELAMIGAAMVSWRSVGNMTGNFAVGFVADALGVRKAAGIWFVIVALFFVTVMVLGHNEWALYFAALCFGMNSSVLRTPVPLTIRTLFGTRYFSNIYGVLNAVKPLMSGVAATLIAVSYDIAGSYMGALALGLGIIALSAIVYFSGASFMGKYDYEHASD